MIKLRLQREKSFGGATLSRLYKENGYLCDVLEDEVRELPGVPIANWKVHGVTAIPHGTYEVVAQSSPKFGPRTLTLLNVPGYEYIRIHGGNRSTDTEGCLLPGTRAVDGKSVRQSQAALTKLKALLIPYLERGEKVTIEIVKAR